MAELDTNDFGIEKTVSVDTAGAGDQNLLNDLFSPETSTTDPKDVTAIDDNDDGGSQKGPDGKANPTSLAGKEDDIPETTAKNPEALTNFLLGGDEEEEEEEEDDDDGAEPSSTVTETTTIKASNTDDGDEEEEEEGEGEGDDEPSIAFDNLANELADLGVFNRMEGEEEGFSIKSPEDFLERFKAEKERGAQQMISEFIGQFGADYQEAFDSIFVKGVNPREYYSQSAEIEDFTNMDLSVEKNQESVVRQTLADQGFEKEDIDAEIEKLKNYGDLEDVSKRHHKVLAKKQKQALQQKEQLAQQEQQLKQAQKQTYVENVRNVLTEKLKAKEFDGIPLNTQTANELQDFLLVDKWKTPTGETLTDFDKTILELKNPDNHATKVKVGLLLKLLDKDPTLSTIQKRGVSKKSSQLFKDVARQKTTAKRAVDNKKQPAKSWFQ